MSTANPEYITLFSLCWKGQVLDCIWLVPACKRPRTKEIYIIAGPLRPRLPDAFRNLCVMPTGTLQASGTRLGKPQTKQTVIILYMSGSKPKYITLFSLCWKGQAPDYIWLVLACKRPRTKEICIIAGPSRPRLPDAFQNLCVIPAGHDMYFEWKSKQRLHCVSLATRPNVCHERTTKPDYGNLQLGSDG